jgi:hypothetical protein
MKQMTRKLLLLGALLPAFAFADAGCEEVLILGATQAIGPATFVGEADSNLGVMSVSVTITSTKPNQDGSINATTSHTFSVNGLVFTTRDRARLVPLNNRGQYRLDTQATIVDGAWGHLRLDGLLNFATGEAKWLADGQVCAG